MKGQIRFTGLHVGGARARKSLAEFMAWLNLGAPRGRRGAALQLGENKRLRWFLMFRMVWGFSPRVRSDCSTTVYREERGWLYWSSVAALGISTVQGTSKDTHGQFEVFPGMDRKVGTTGVEFRECHQ